MPRIRGRFPFYPSVHTQDTLEREFVQTEGYGYVEFCVVEILSTESGPPPISRGRHDQVNMIAQEYFIML
jgi:hypothetical protein